MLTLDEALEAFDQTVAWYRAKIAAGASYSVTTEIGPTSESTTYSWSAQRRSGEYRLTVCVGLTPGPRVQVMQL